MKRHSNTSILTGKKVRHSTAVQGVAQNSACTQNAAQNAEYTQNTKQNAACTQNAAQSVAYMTARVITGILFMLSLAAVMMMCEASTAWAADGQSNQKMPEDTVTYDVLDVSIADLESADIYYDEQVVEITGEVVGDRINSEWSDDHYWLTLESRDESTYSEVAVYVDEEATELVDTYGVYEKVGTILQIKGTFNLACPEHEGLSDLHAESVEVVSQGYEEHEEVNLWAFIPAAILVLIGFVLIIVFYRMREGLR